MPSCLSGGEHGLILEQQLDTEPGGWGSIRLLSMLGYLRRGRAWGNVGVLPMVGYLRRSRGVALSRISHFPVLVDVYIQKVEISNLTCERKRLGL